MPPRPPPPAAPAFDTTTRQFLLEGDRHFRNGEYEQALVSYRNAGRRVPRSPVPLYKVGLTQLMLGDLAAAAATFEQVLSLAPDHAGAKKNLELVRKRLPR
jgi:TolA-binding protein